MPTEFVLLDHTSDSGRSTAVVVPSWGASPIAFAFHDPRLQWPVSVLEPVDIATIAQKPTSYGMPILAPTPGRVGKNQNGELRYGGLQYRVSPTRHGVLRDRLWRLVEFTHERVKCSVEVDPGSTSHGYFPFPFAAEHEVTLGDRQLESRVRLRNLAAHPIPLDVGWHPYLACGGDCVVTIPAASFWELDAGQPGIDQPTPTGRLLPVGPRLDFRNGKSLTAGREDLDDILTGLPSGDVVSTVEETTDRLLASGAVGGVAVRRHVVLPEANDGALQPLRHIQIYTPPSRDAICIEPLSAPPNAINLDDVRFHEVGPGGVVEFRVVLKIEIEPI